jgi:Mu-like prophage I protein
MTDAPSFSTFTDAPIDLAAPTGDSPVTKRFQIAEVGRFKDPRYGEFEITAADVDSWKKLLAEEFQGEVPIDFDHNTDKGGPTGSRAAAWIKSIVQDGAKVLADVEFTPEGAESVRNRAYRYISPTFVGDYKDKRQRSRGPALLRAALTNNPFLRDMPAISLSAAPLEAERVEPELPVGIGVGDRVTCLGKSGTCVRAGDDFDVTFDDGTRAQTLDRGQLEPVAAWDALTEAEPPEPVDLQATLSEVARLLSNVTASR